MAVADMLQYIHGTLYLCDEEVSYLNEVSFVLENQKIQKISLDVKSHKSLF